MANRYWVPNGGTGTGNWDGANTSNWSATSGGAGGASVPTSADNVFFDANSFNGAGQVVTIVTAAANCLDMNWTGVTNSPALVGSQGVTIYGSLTFVGGMTVSGYTGNITFNSTTTGKTVTTAGLALASNITFFGVGGGYTLQDNLTSTGNFALSNGTLDTNSKTISVASFTCNSGATRTLTLGSSTINTTGNIAFSSTALTLSAASSTFVVGGTTRTFAGGGVTFGNITLTATSVTISGSSSFNTITITAGKTVNITSGTTQTYTSLVANGTPSSKITLQSTTAGSAATLSKASGVSVIRNITLKDITATGGATFYALGTTNVSGNTGWAFQMLIKQEKLSGSLMSLYHIDSTGTMSKVSG